MVPLIGGAEFFKWARYIWWWHAVRGGGERWGSGDLATEPPKTVFQKRSLIPVHFIVFPPRSTRTFSRSSPPPYALSPSLSSSTSFLDLDIPVHYLTILTTLASRCGFTFATALVFAVLLINSRPVFLSLNPHSFVSSWLTGGDPPKWLALRYFSPPPHFVK